MKRWNIVLPTGQILKMYYKTYDEAKKSFAEASISEDTDTDFYKYIEKIKNSSTSILKDFKDREIWEIPHNNGTILYRQFLDEEGKYIDGCTYQRWDNIGAVLPVTKQLCTPKEFYETFLKSEKDSFQSVNLVSIKELKNKKAKLIYRGNGNKYWIGLDGTFYIARKEWLPTKYSIDEYNTFHDSNEAVFVSYGTEVAFRKRKWFKNLSEFQTFFHEEWLKNNSLNYEVLKYGYRKKPPEDRKLIISLPYIDLDTEINLAKKDTANQNCIKRKIANTWIDKTQYGLKDIVEEFILIYISKIRK